MANLTTKQRKGLKKSSFALPGKRGYPIPDKSHARNALSRAAEDATPAERAEIRAKVRRKFPSIGQGNSKHEPHDAIGSH